MSPVASTKKSIAVIVDERASRERALYFNQCLQHLRVHAKVDVLPEGLDEDGLLAKLDEAGGAYDLVLMPWYRYLAWSKIEGYFGLNRVSGRTCAGYFLEQLMPFELDFRPSYQRIILLDFFRLGPGASVQQVLMLADESKRCGSASFFGVGGVPKIWSTKWNSQDDLGAFLVDLAKLELRNDCPFLHPTLFRSAVLTLWDIVFEESGRRAVVDFAYNLEQVVVRVVYPKQGWSPTDVIAAFFPDASKSTDPYQLIRRYCDTVRAHWIADRSEIELTVSFQADSPVDKAFDEFHTLWIEPVSANLLAEDKGGMKSVDNLHQREKSEVDRLLEKVEQLRKDVQAKDKKIQEMRMGGVGQGTITGLPDAGILIEAFHQRYFESLSRIQSLRKDIAQASSEGAFQSHLEHLNKELTTMLKEEDKWIQRLAGILKAYREHRESDQSQQQPKS